MNSADFIIRPSGPVSRQFVARDIATFKQACSFIRELPYGRNENKNYLLSVFTDHCGTCSTKHALLKQLSVENQVKEIKLMLGIFKMNGKNTPVVKHTLEKYKLDHIPEAHNYLRYKNEIIDVTKNGWQASDFIQELIVEIEILPGQITDFKVHYHKNFLKKWLNENTAASFTPDEIWEIREQCIRDLSG